MMNLCAIRTKSGLTQSEVAKALNVTQSAVAMWENGRTYPRVSVLKKLADLYNCTVDDLLKEEREEQKDEDCRCSIENCD